MEPLSEYARTRLELAREMLADAKSLCDEGRLRSAADRAYYTMFHAAQAALAGRGEKAPRAPKGLRAMLGGRPGGGGGEGERRPHGPTRACGPCSASGW